MSGSNQSKVEYIFLDENAKDVEDKLNQWKESHFLKLHGLRSYTASYGTLVSVMVELTDKDPNHG